MFSCQDSRFYFEIRNSISKFLSREDFREDDEVLLRCVFLIEKNSAVGFKSESVCAKTTTSASTLHKDRHSEDTKD